MKKLWLALFSLGILLSNPALSQEPTSQQKEAFEKFKQENGKEWAADWSRAQGNPNGVFGGIYKRMKYPFLPAYSSKAEIYKYSSSVTPSPIPATQICDLNNKLCIKNINLDQFYISPNGDGVQDSISFNSTILVKHTDEIEGSRRKSQNGDIKKFFLVSVISLEDSKGNIIKTIESEAEIAKPYDCVDFSENLIYGNSACQWIRMKNTALWTGDGNIEIVDGEYGYSLSFEVRRIDTLGNNKNITKIVSSLSTAKGYIIIDNTPPNISFVSPINGAILTMKRPYFYISFNDNYSGLITETIHETLDGEDITIYMNVITASATYTPNYDLSIGSHIFMFSLSDKSGNTSNETVIFNIIESNDMDNITSVYSFLDSLKEVYLFKPNFDDLIVNEYIKYSNSEFIKISQYFNGIPVEFSDLIISSDINGNPHSIFGNYYNDIPVDLLLTPKYSYSFAIDNLLAYLNKFRNDLTFITPPNLVIFPINGSFKLAYKILLPFIGDTYIGWVDANNGDRLWTNHILYNHNLPPADYNRYNYLGVVSVPDMYLYYLDVVGLPYLNNNLVGKYTGILNDTDSNIYPNMSYPLLWYTNPNSHEFQIISAYFWLQMAGDYFNKIFEKDIYIKNVEVHHSPEIAGKYPADINIIAKCRYRNYFNQCISHHYDFRIRYDENHANSAGISFHELTHAVHSYIISLYKYVKPTTTVFEYIISGFKSFGTYGEYIDTFTEAIAAFFGGETTGYNGWEIIFGSNGLGPIHKYYSLNEIAEKYTFSHVTSGRRSFIFPESYNYYRWDNHFPAKLWTDFLWRLKNQIGDKVDLLLFRSMESVGRDYNHINMFFNIFNSFNLQLFKGEHSYEIFMSANLANIKLPNNTNYYPIILSEKSEYNAKYYGSGNNIRYEIVPIFHIFTGQYLDFIIKFSPEHSSCLFSSSGCNSNNNVYNYNGISYPIKPEPYSIMAYNNNLNVYYFNGSTLLNYQNIVTSLRKYIGSDRKITIYYYITSSGKHSVKEEVPVNFRYQSFVVQLPYDIPNNPPVSIIDNLPLSEYYTGIPISFNSSSYDPDNDEISYIWYFSDGSTENGRNVTHSFNIPGDYNITLTTTDKFGLSSNTSTTIKIVHDPYCDNNLLPVVSNNLVRAATGDRVRFDENGVFQYGVVNFTGYFSSEGTHDPEGGILKYKWEIFNNTDGGQMIYSNLGANNIQYYFIVGNKEYTCRLTVTDDCNQTTYSDFSIIALTPQTADENDCSTFKTNKKLNYTFIVLFPLFYIIYIKWLKRRI